MTWFKVDDSFHSHPKVLASEPAALGLWVVAGTWSSANLTDGFVPDHVLPRLLPDSVKLAEALVTCGLWRRAKGGYRFHDWCDYNPSSAEVKKERDAARVRMRTLRANRKGAGQSGKRSGERNRTSPNTARTFAKKVPDRESETAPDNLSGSQGQAAYQQVTPKVVRPNNPRTFGRSSQPRPDPTRSSSYEELTGDAPPASPGPPKGSKTDRGTRLPDDFTVTPAMTEWAREKAPLCGIDDHEAFCDYWRSVPGSKGRKLDWEKTWRNWMRRENERRTGNGRRTVGGPRPSTTDAAVTQTQALKAELGLTHDNPQLNLIRGELA